MFLDITLNYNQQRIPTDNSNESKSPLSKFNYSNADWDQLNHALKEINWTTVLWDNSANKAHTFLTKVEEVCKNILPIKNHKGTCTLTLIPRERRVLMRKRTRIMQRLKASITQTNTRKLLNSLHEIGKQIHNVFTSSRKPGRRKSNSNNKIKPKILLQVCSKI